MEKTHCKKHHHPHLLASSSLPSFLPTQVTSAQHRLVNLAPLRLTVCVGILLSSSSLFLSIIFPKRIRLDSLQASFCFISIVVYPPPEHLSDPSPGIDTLCFETPCVISRAHLLAWTPSQSSDVPTFASDCRLERAVLTPRLPIIPPRSSSSVLSARSPKAPAASRTRPLPLYSHSARTLL